jgi:hypothetical protein
MIKVEIYKGNTVTFITPQQTVANLLPILESDTALLWAGVPMFWSI